MAFATPLFTDPHFHAYRWPALGNGAATTDMIDARGARNVWLHTTASVAKVGNESVINAIKVMVPIVPAGFTSIDDLSTTNAKAINPLTSESDGASNPVESLHPQLQIPGMQLGGLNWVGFIAGDICPPFFYLDIANLSADYIFTCWVNFSSPRLNHT